MSDRKKRAEKFRIYHLAEAPASLEGVVDDFVQAGAERLGEILAKNVKPLREALRAKKVDGYVACEGDHPLGLTVFQEREGNARINFVHVLSTCQDADLAARLIRWSVDTLQESGAGRVTCEAPIVAHESAIRRTFAELGFRAIGRMVMAATLQASPAERPLPTGYALTCWDDRHLKDLVQIVHEANSGTLDELVYPEFKTAAGTERMIRAIQGGAAGPFDEGASQIILHEAVPCGAILCTRPAPTEGFVAEMAVDKAHQGKGMGRALLARALTVAYGEGVQTVKLGVTEENLPAVSLYRKLGFTPVERITAYVWEAD